MTARHLISRLELLSEEDKDLPIETYSSKDDIFYVLNEIHVKPKDAVECIWEKY